MSTETDEATIEIDSLRKLKDADIDTSEQPEIQDWSKAVRGHFYRPVKKSVTIRLDADVIAWFKAHAPARGYQTAINRALREYVARQR